MSRQQGTTDPSSSKEELDGKDGNENEQASFDENEDEKARNEEIANQLLIDDVVKELIEMELKQRKKKGDTEGFEAGMEHWLKFNIWKVEEEWKEKKASEAKKATIQTSRRSWSKRPQSQTKERKIPGKI